MPLPDIRLLLPKTGETQEMYCQRLQDDGHEEMFIRKGLRFHFAMPLEEFGDFFDNFKEARLRHMASLKQLAPNRTDYSFARKVSRNLGISQERAEDLVQIFKENNI